MDDTSKELEAMMREEQRARDVEFSFAFVGVGSDPNRTPSDATLRPGATVNPDSAGDVDGYIGDLARMGIVGEPSPAHVEALAVVDSIQQAARLPIRHGAIAARVFETAGEAIADGPFADRLDFIELGIGMVSHEAPRIALPSDNRHRYPPTHRDRPLEAGMSVSIETTLVDRELGYVKLEDTVAVTQDGCEGLGDGFRHWNTIEAGGR